MPVPAPVTIATLLDDVMLRVSSSEIRKGCVVNSRSRQRLAPVAIHHMARPLHLRAHGTPSGQTGRSQKVRRTPPRTSRGAPMETTPYPVRPAARIVLKRF